MNKPVKILFCSLILCGCVSTTVSEKLPLAVPASPEVRMREVKWSVTDSSVCLTPEMYSNLSLNTEDVKALIEYQNEVIKMYKEYYEPEPPKLPDSGSTDRNGER